MKAPAAPYPCQPLGLSVFFSLAILISMVVLKSQVLLLLNSSLQILTPSFSWVMSSARRGSLWTWLDPPFTFSQSCLSPPGGGEEGWLTADASPSSLGFVSTEGRYCLPLSRGPSAPGVVVRRPAHPFPFPLRPTCRSLSWSPTLMSMRWKTG